MITCNHCLRKHKTEQDLLGCACRRFDHHTEPKSYEEVKVKVNEKPKHFKRLPMINSCYYCSHNQGKYTDIKCDRHNFTDDWVKSFNYVCEDFK